MIGHDEGNEEVQFKVADKRKFNSDGSLRDGVVLEASPEPQKERFDAPKEEKRAPNEPETGSFDDVSGGSVADKGAPDADEGALDDDLGEDLPGAQDPASFVNFLSTLATNAAAALGAIPHPSTGQRSLDLESGKYWLDVLGMLRDKTKGNLHEKESRLLEGLLGDLRMQYVQISRAAEERLKAQAAQKFSASDILGKKPL